MLELLNWKAEMGYKAQRRPEKKSNVPGYGSWLGLHQHDLPGANSSESIVETLRSEPISSQSTQPLLALPNQAPSTYNHEDQIATFKKKERTEINS
jgi:hypothetical protein